MSIDKAHCAGTSITLSAIARHGRANTTTEHAKLPYNLLKGMESHYLCTCRSVQVQCIVSYIIEDTWRSTKEDWFIKTTRSLKDEMSNSNVVLNRMRMTIHRDKRLHAKVGSCFLFHALLIIFHWQCNRVSIQKRAKQALNAIILDPWITPSTS